MSRGKNPITFIHSHPWKTHAFHSRDPFTPMHSTARMKGVGLPVKLVLPDIIFNIVPDYLEVWHILLREPGCMFLGCNTNAFVLDVVRN